MKDLKLLRALKTLNRDEWMSFRKYLLSCTGSSSEIFSLFSILQSKKSNFNSIKEPNDFRAKHFPKLTQKAFLGLLSKVYKFFEDWIAVYEFSNSEYEKELFLIKALFRKGLSKEAITHAKKLKNKVEKVNHVDFKLNKIIGEVDHLLYFSTMIGTAESRHELLISASRKKAIAYKELCQFYISELHNRGRIHKHDFSEIIDMLSASSSRIPDTELSNLGYSLIQVLTNNDLAHFEILINAILDNKFKSGTGLLDDILVYVNASFKLLYSIGKIKNNSLIYPFLNYQLKVENEKEKGKLHQVKFHNFIDTVANFSSFDQARELIDYWIDKVETPNKKETKDLAYSQIYFIKRDFKTMVKYSRFIAFNNYGQKTRAWLHNVICQYMFRNENYNLAIQSLSSFKNYLKRNKKKFSKNYFLANLNLVSLMELLVKNDYKVQDINLENYKVLFYRKWITEEVEKAKRK